MFIKNPIYFVTSNSNKLREVSNFLKKNNSCLKIEAISLDIPELQGDPLDISTSKCLRASQLLVERGITGSVLVEDTCLCFNALHGLPGPYIKWFVEKIGHEGLNNMLAAYEDKSAYALCIFSLFDQTTMTNPVTFEGRCDGQIVKARGAKNFGWDPIFQPLESPSNRTFAEISEIEKNEISHRARALKSLEEYIIKLSL